MAVSQTNARTPKDYVRAARSLATHFNSDTVYVIGSQAVLASWPEAPGSMFLSPEIDAYPGNAKAWEKAHPGEEASEEVNALFGQGSEFEKTFGFYIDGVDEKTAALPPDWLKRAKTMEIDNLGKTIKAISPSIEDTIVAKLARLDERDREFILAAHEARRLDLSLIGTLYKSTDPDPAFMKRAESFMAWLASLNVRPAGPDE